MVVDLGFVLGVFAVAVVAALAAVFATERQARERERQQQMTFGGVYLPPPLTPPPPPFLGRERAGFWAGAFTTDTMFVQNQVLTPEQVEMQRQRFADLLRHDREREGANERAEALLQERLGPWQGRLFGLTGKLMRPSKLWQGTEYLVQRGHKVQVIVKGKVQTELCVVSDKGEPEADRIMSILDLIDTDERRLWEMANVTPRR